MDGKFSKNVFLSVFLKLYFGRCVKLRISLSNTYQGLMDFWSLHFMVLSFRFLITIFVNKSPQIRQILTFESKQAL